jgi:prepilin-type N-terminal cleavage/methylation domain-containing protein
MYRIKKDTAFTLIELLVVLVVLAVGLVTLLLVLRNAHVNNAASHFITVAAELAEGRMEDIIADREGEGFGYITDSNYPAENPVNGFGSYKREVDIYYVDTDDLDSPSGSATNYKRVEVTVASRQDASQRISLVTVVSDY